jgi:hypothetical protein
MKKLLLLTSFVMLFVASCFSQELKKVSRMRVMNYDHRTKEFVNKETTYPKEIYVIIKGGVVHITSTKEQKIYTYGSPEKTNYDTHSVYTWPAVDKDGTSCTFMIKIFNDGSIAYLFLYSSVDLLIEFLMD